MGDLLHQLGINWKLLLASIVNFFILFFVLRTYVFRPLIAMLEKRERTIADAVKNSQAIELQLAELEAEKAEAMKQARHGASQLLEHAATAAEKLRAETLADAQAEAKTVLAKAQEEISRERSNLKLTVRHDIAELVVAATEKVLDERLTADADTRLVERTLADLEKQRV